MASRDAAEQALAQAEQLLARRELAKACTAFQQAEQLGADPDACCGGRWLAFMLCGAFEAAWRQSDAIRTRGAADPHRFWQGQSIKGQRLMVRSLHGLGDAVQLLRYAPRLTLLAGSVTFEVPPDLVELARCFRGVEQVITWGPGAPLQSPPWDVQVEITELPYLFRTTMAELPIAERYLEVPQSALRTYGACLPARTRPRVGLVWAAGVWNRERCLPPAALTPLLQCHQVEFLSLQGGEDAAEAQGMGLLDVNQTCGEGLLALAAAMTQLDLVITVDTLAAHLAGALAIPIWVMLQRAADWRWMVEREDSPWYPTMRLFRQVHGGGWHRVVLEVRDALCARYPEAEAPGQNGALTSNDDQCE